VRMPIGCNIKGHKKARSVTGLLGKAKLNTMQGLL